jgi:DNA-binding NarL/FixJ family response regulator
MVTEVRIALVDDQDIFRITFASLLEKRMKAKVVFRTANGNELLERMDELEVDLVITDLAMPEMDGMLLCKKIKEKYPAQKIIVLTTYNDKALIRKLLKIGVNGFLPKDSRLEEVLALVQQITSPN